MHKLCFEHFSGFRTVAGLMRILYCVPRRLAVLLYCKLLSGHFSTTKTSIII